MPQGVEVWRSKEEFGMNSIQMLCQAVRKCAAWLQYLCSAVAIRSDFCRHFIQQQEAEYCRLLHVQRVVYQGFVCRKSAVIHTQQPYDNIEIDNSKAHMLISACLIKIWGKIVLKSIQLSFSEHCAVEVCKLSHLFACPKTSNIYA